MALTTPVAETFDEVRKLVFDRVHTFLGRFRVDRAEVVAEAFYGFMLAYDSYDPTVGAFTTWVQFKVDKRLMTLLRKRIDYARKKVVNVGVEILETIQDRVQKEQFDSDVLFFRLSKDARDMVKLVLDHPTDVRLLLRQMGTESPGNWRQVIREFFTELDWTPDRIRKTFQEIKEKL